MRLLALIIAFFCFATAPMTDCFVVTLRPRAQISTTRQQAFKKDDEEILLRVKLGIRAGHTVAEAKRKLSQYSQSFPFSAVLPVQPLMYVPTEDDGVEVKFLRKKTDIKSGIEGGIRFYIEETADHSLEVTALRNPEGQTIPKIVAERLVITSFVKGIKGEEENKYGEPPTDILGIQSIFHKWMDSGN
ncbi:hypothetical protein FisN_17Lh067 [Fistulifera solaris]|uniref:Plastid lipid-associated protein/fibrillin conserved domain-containing protein n=1 Tax=Fistulifera solaris TaxID=1519565 RepID=A0A1Z5K1D3_FISSO|nr:hypothetical protein FisN_17Lh067 [Fistulifera solaris]|eukprot:GAX20114.1 hypothetical protein FisN_17Lh067 [Fistulifera solaris]